jgi:hypothetical protein
MKNHQTQWTLKSRIVMKFGMHICVPVPVIFDLLSLILFQLCYMAVKIGPLKQEMQEK